MIFVIHCEPGTSCPQCCSPPSSTGLSEGSRSRVVCLAIFHLILMSLVHVQVEPHYELGWLLLLPMLYSFAPPRPYRVPLWVQLKLGSVHTGKGFASELYLVVKHL